MLKVKITGSNGYLGSLLTAKLQAKNYRVSGIDRSLLHKGGQLLKEEIKDVDIIINLAGASILRKWTKANKKLIYDSRIKTTSNLVKAINDLAPNEGPKTFISASAIGIYKNEEKHDEGSTNFDDGFVGKVVADWEKELHQLPASVNTTIFRIGLVLGKEAKTIKNLLTPFKMGLGGKIGSGKQAFPFIHEKDLVNAFIWAIENAETNRVHNLVAPEQITNLEFTNSLAKRLKRPAFITVPAFAVKMVLGEAASLLLESPVIEPKELIENGFNFSYPSIESSLEEIFE